MPSHSNDKTGPAPTRPRREGWLHTPQRLLLRRAIFQIHLWIGILLTVYAIVIGLSGSALVFKNEIERALEPKLFHLPVQSATIPLDTVVERVQNERPGWTVFALRDFDRPGVATGLLLRSAQGPASANYRLVSVDPSTGAVLADAMRFSGVLGWLSNLHFYLLSGKTGLLVSGWMAVGLMILCISGIILWWPGIARWVSSLWLRPRRSWRRLNWDLHSFIGFWSCAALLAVMFTGIYFAFPEPTGSLVIRATGAKPSQDPKDPPARKITGRDTGPSMSINEAIAHASTLLPHNAPPAYMTISGPRGTSYYVTGYYRGTAPYSQLATISFDAHTGTLLTRSDTREQILGQRIVQYFFAVHFGSFGGDGIFGLCVKAIWVFLGLAPALLAVTGLIMYWNRKLSKLWLRSQATSAR